MDQHRAQFEKVLEHLATELSSIRTGRANPATVEPINITAYGSVLPLVQLASITVQDARTIVVQPWDKNVMKDIERGLQEANLGMTPVNDGHVLRLTVPLLTEERRREYVKILRAKLEEARISIRRIREDILRDLKTKKQDGQLGEDAFFGQQKELQKTVDELVADIDRRGEEKEKEILTV